LTGFTLNRTVQTTMNNLLRFSFCVLGILISSFNQSQAAPAATNETTLRLGLELRDGSHVVGKSLDDTLRFHSTLLGDLKLPVAGIRSLEMAATNDGPVRLTTTNNDVLSGRIITTVLRVETSFGKTDLPVNLIRSLTVSLSGNSVNQVLNTPNLLGFWRFDAASQANSCVNGYTGELQGNARIGAPGSGHSGSGSQALVLDGYNSYLTTSLTGQIENQGTILAWVYLTAQPSGAGRIFSIVSQSQNGNDFDLQIEPDNYTKFYTDTGSATVYAQALPLNEWHFLAATFVANSTRDIYLDGQRVASGPCGGHSVNNSPFWFGNCRVFGPRCFLGRIDDVAIFNRALSAEEIQSIYAGQK
jgi:hypothetical protein